jgi:hypothetical protein
MEDPVVKTGRREAAFALTMWFVAMSVTVATCYRYGYQQDPGEPMSFVLWFPSWIFWGLIVPWLACSVVSAWFAFFYMQDEPIEDERIDPVADVNEEAPGA